MKSKISQLERERRTGSSQNPYKKEVERSLKWRATRVAAKVTQMLQVINGLRKETKVFISGDDKELPQGFEKVVDILRADVILLPHFEDCFQICHGKTKKVPSLFPLDPVRAVLLGKRVCTEEFLNMPARDRLKTPTLEFVGIKEATGIFMTKAFADKHPQIGLAIEKLCKHKLLGSKLQWLSQEDYKRWQSLNKPFGPCTQIDRMSDLHKFVSHHAKLDMKQSCVSWSFM